MAAPVLIIDDDPTVRTFLQKALRTMEIEPVLADRGRAGLELFEAQSFALVLLDLELPDLSGLEVLPLIKARDPSAAVLMLTGHGDIPTAVRAMQLGAEQFLTKPIDVDQLEHAVHNALGIVRLRRRAEFEASRTSDAFQLARLGESPAMRPVVEAVDALAATDATLLLTGETGVGKGWTARLVHSLSKRAAGPFVSINCGGRGATELGAELFGEETVGARRAAQKRPGLLDAAAGGTLFLDEIGEIAAELQPRLVTLLESHRYRPLGSTREAEADVRLIAASSHDLRAATTRGAFGRDLYWALAAHPIAIPPLRERGTDAVAEIAFRLLGDLRRQLGRGPRLISGPALQILSEHDWPGNIRELGNVLEHVVLRAGNANEVLPSHLPADLRTRASTTDHADPADWTLATLLQDTERRHILRTLDAADGNRSRAADLLGISRATLYEKLKRHGIGG